MENITIDLPINFEFPAERLDALRAKAREVDDDNIGSHCVEYTPAQALTAVFHFEPGWLAENILVGWSVGADLEWGAQESSDEEEED